MIHSNITNSLDILVNKIEDVKLTIKDEVERRFEEFKDIGKNGDELDLFSELSFCVLTANWRAKGGIKAQKFITKEGFAHYNEEQLISKLREVGHRFPNTRSRYIVENRWIIGSLKNLTSKRYFRKQKVFSRKYKRYRLERSQPFFKKRWNRRRRYIR